MSETRANAAKQFLQPPLIGPLAEAAKRPLWSVMIPTFNRTEYLEQALKAILGQDLGPEKMHIEVIDNCSTKSEPEALVREIGQGRISFYRQPKNVGLVGNFTSCIQRARGHLVHILHDDDLVAPGFYEHMQEAFEKEPSIGAAFCRTLFINAEGHPIKSFTLQNDTPCILENWLERIAVKNLIQPPAIVVRRSAYEALGGFHPQLVHACDWEMWARIAAHYSIWYEPKILAYSRVHSSSEFSAFIRSGENVVDERRAIEIIYSHLPHSEADRLYKKVSENCSIWNILGASRMLARGDVEAASVQIRAALRGQLPSVRVMGLLALLPIRSLGVYIKNTLDFA
jgi:glycosyltransferase involved in cell wall biosynthesis